MTDHLPKGSPSRPPQTHIPAEARERPLSGRRRWRFWVAGALALVLLMAIVGLRLAPCWPTYRLPQPDRLACFATFAAQAALANDHRGLGLAALEVAWARGRRSEETVSAAVATSLQANDDGAVARWLERARGLSLPAEALEAGVRSVGSERDPRYVAWRERAPAGAIGAGLSRTSVEAAGFEPAALERLLTRAMETHASAVILVKDGAIAGEWYFDGATRRTETMSSTKAIAGLGIGLLVADGRIASVDAPISTFFPQWAHGLEASVSLRHVLTHTSGLEARRDVFDFIWRDDFAKAALDSRVIREPGSTYFYNNKAMGLLVGVVRVASGKALDALLDERLFGPLGIRQWDWLRDPHGNPQGAAGLRVHPLDLAKIGVMLADGGVWQGQRVLPADWIAAATSPSVSAAPDWGYLFALHRRRSERTLDEAGVARIRAAGFAPELVAKLQPLVGKRLDRDEWLAAAERALGDVGALVDLSRQGLIPQPVRSPEVIGFSAIGSFGIHLTVFPGAKLVAVRMAPGASEDEEMPEFPSMVRRLLPALSPEDTASP